MLDHPLALDRLEEERRGPSTSQRLPEAIEITEGNLLAPGNQRLEPFAQPGEAVERQRPEGETVERVGPMGETRSTGGSAGDLDRRLHRLGPAVDEEDPVVPAVHESLQAIRQRDRKGWDLELDQRRWCETKGLLEGVAEHGMITADRKTGVAPDRVEVSITPFIDEVGTIPGDESMLEAGDPQEVEESWIQLRGIRRRRTATIRIENRLQIESGRLVHSPRWTSRNTPA